MTCAASRRRASEHRRRRTVFFGMKKQDQLTEIADEEQVRQVMDEWHRLTAESRGLSFGPSVTLHPHGVDTELTRAIPPVNGRAGDLKMMNDGIGPTTSGRAAFPAGYAGTSR